MPFAAGECCSFAGQHCPPGGCSLLAELPTALPSHLLLNVCDALRLVVLLCLHALALFMALWLPSYPLSQSYRPACYQCSGHIATYADYTPVVRPSLTSTV